MDRRRRAVGSLSDPAARPLKQGPLVADLAPAESRSRYMAVNGFSWQLGFTAGPGLGGLLLAAHRYALWPVAIGICAVAAIAALALEGSMPAGTRTTPARKRQLDGVQSRDELRGRGRVL